MLPWNAGTIFQSFCEKGFSTIPVAFPVIDELGAHDSAGSWVVHDILTSCVDGDDRLTRDDLADMCVATLDGKLLDPHSAVNDQVENMSHLQICHRVLGGMHTHQMEGSLYEFMKGHDSTSAEVVYTSSGKFRPFQFDRSLI